jgi:hypothetical protein
MRHNIRRSAGGALLVAGAFLMRPPSEAAAQGIVRSSAAEITLTGRVHSQFNTTSVTGAPGSEFLIRRARVAAELEISDIVSGKVEPDFGEGSISLKDAYVRLTFSPALRATFGQMKRPFDLFELTSSSQILVIERAGGIRGVSGCPRLGGVCSFSRFTERLQYSDRDIGLFLEGAPSAPVTWSFAATNGTGANSDDENGTKSFTGRVNFAATPNVTVGANVAMHDYAFAGDDEYATAFGGDVEIGNYDQGLHVQAGFITGDNWLVDPGDPTTFFAVQGIVSYKSPVTNNRYVSALEPLGRLSIGNPDTDTPDDGGILITPGVMLHFTGRNKIAANIDVWAPSVGDTEWSLKVQSFLHF